MCSIVSTNKRVLMCRKGPDTLSYVRALIRIEQEWLRRFAKPFPPPFHLHANGSPQSHIDLLDHLHALAPHMMAPEIERRVLWHRDLHGANVFLEAKENPDICGVIDWQGVSVLPLYMQATDADFFCYKGTNVVVEPGEVLPSYRVPLDEAAPPEARERLQEEYKAAVRQKLYELHVGRSSLWHSAVQHYPFREFIVPPILKASRTWYEGSDHLREALFRLRVVWEKLAPGTPFPLQIDDAEWGRHCAAYERRTRYEARVEELERKMELEGDGWVKSERFGEVKRMNDELRAQWDEEVEGGPYPFQDGAPSWFVGS